MRVMIVPPINEARVALGERAKFLWSSKTFDGYSIEFWDIEELSITPDNWHRDFELENGRKLRVHGRTEQIGYAWIE